MLNSEKVQKLQVDHIRYGATKHNQQLLSACPG
jgi:hypothetical protein